MDADRNLLRVLIKWCHDRKRRGADDVFSCRLCLPDVGCAAVFFVTNSEKFNFLLAEELALERQLAGHGWRVSVSQLPAAPASSLAAFYDSMWSVLVYANS